jgi:hypothetical protein
MKMSSEKKALLLSQLDALRKKGEKQPNLKQIVAKARKDVAFAKRMVKKSRKQIR